MANRDQRVIGYILKGYGRTSETFISNEIALLEGAGVRIRVFSLKRLTGEKSHGVTRRITVPVTYLPEVSGDDGQSVLTWLWQNWQQFGRAHRRVRRLRPWIWTRTLLGQLFLTFQTSGLPHRGSGAWRTALREFLQAGFIAAELLEGQGEEITHLHAHFAHTATTVAMLASRLAGRPFSFTAHAKDIYRVDMNPGDLLARKLRAARFTVTCTKANVEYLTRFAVDEKKIRGIYHGIDLDLFSHNQRTETTTPPLILAVGRFVEKKGFPVLVEACRILRDQGIAFQTRIIGGFTPLTAEIERMVAEYGLGDRVTLHPAMTQEELARVYAMASIFALPCLITDDGDRDGIPNVLVEAMASGIAVVSTRVSGIPELVRDGETGLLVEPRDPQGLAGAIRRLLDTASLRAALGQCGCQLVCHEFDARRNIAKLKELFELGRETGQNGAK